MWRGPVYACVSVYVCVSVMMALLGIQFSSILLLCKKECGLCSADGHPQVRMCLKHIFVTYEVLFFLRATSAWACFILMASTSYMAAGTKFSLSGSSFKWQHAHLNIIIVRSWFCVQKILLCM
jgi:hypothetical protein